jgi:hypothetical protein
MRTQTIILEVSLSNILDALVAASVVFSSALVAASVVFSTASDTAVFVVVVGVALIIL